MRHPGPRAFRRENQLRTSRVLSQAVSSSPTDRSRGVLPHSLAGIHIPRDAISGYADLHRITFFDDEVHCGWLENAPDPVTGAWENPLVEPRPRESRAAKLPRIPARSARLGRGRRAGRASTRPCRGCTGSRGEGKHSPHQEGLRPLGRGAGGAVGLDRPGRDAGGPRIGQAARARDGRGTRGPPRAQAERPPARRARPLGAPAVVGLDRAASAGPHGGSAPPGRAARFGGSRRDLPHLGEEGGPRPVPAVHGRRRPELDGPRGGDQAVGRGAGGHGRPLAPLPRLAPRPAPRPARRRHGQGPPAGPRLRPPDAGAALDRRPRRRREGHLE